MKASTYASGADTYSYVKVPSKDGYTPKLAGLNGFGDFAHGVHLNVSIILRGAEAVYFHIHNPYTTALTTSVTANVMYVKD